MDKLHNFINNSKLDWYPWYNDFEIINTYPKYLIRTYIKTNPNNYFELGFIYQFYYKNYDLMKKYYDMAIVLGNSDAMIYLAIYYQYIENNYELMKKYYMMAIKLGKPYTYIDLLRYYKMNI